jgi:hypothetical protein
MAGIGTNIFASGGGSATASTGGSSPALAAQTYGPPAAGGKGPLHPGTGFGSGFWLAVGGAVLLVIVRQSLPR